jgi:hypothetical protein
MLSRSNSEAVHPSASWLPSNRLWTRSIHHIHHDHLQINVTDRSHRVVTSISDVEDAPQDGLRLPGVFTVLEL